MKALRFAVAAVIASAAVAAHAQSMHTSPIPGNHIDDFGPFTYSNHTPKPEVGQLVARSSPISGNYVDDFGPLLSERAAGQEALGAAGAEPGITEARAKEEASIDAYAHERFVEECWRSAA